MEEQKKHSETMIYSILRMSQKALMFVLILIGVGYIGGMISLLVNADLAKPLSDFTQIFIPLFQLEIGVYGLGSTVENVQKIRNQIKDFNENAEKDEKEEKNETQEDSSEDESNG